MLELKLPMDAAVLRANAEMLNKIADTLPDVAQRPTAENVARELFPMMMAANSAVTEAQPEQAAPAVEAAPVVEQAAPAVEAAPVVEQAAPAVEAAPVVEQAAPAGVDLDKEGLPWDVRIHSKNKSKLVSGEWKLKRGVDAALVEQVKGELRQLMAAPAPATAPAEQPAATVFAEQPAASPAVEAAQPAVAPAVDPKPQVAAVVASTTPPASTAPSGNVTTFTELVAAITSNGIAPDEATAACAKHGVASMALLGARPDLVPAVAQELGL